jgi:hypothetical protein
MSLLATVAARAADLAARFGVDIEEPLARWQGAGGHEGGHDAAAWLSVAFLFARTLREPGSTAPNHAQVSE